MRKGSLFQSLEQRGVRMTDIFKSFIQAIEELEDERGQDAQSQHQKPYDEPQMHEENFAAESDPGLNSLLYELDHCEDFPGRLFFEPRSIDGEDPSFWTGKEIGIPSSVAVRTNAYQGRLLPIVDGLFAEE